MIGTALQHPLRLGGMLVGVVLLALLGLKDALAQSALPIEAFKGRFVGSGVAQNDFSDYYGMTVRDLDVTISTGGAGSAGGGFTVAWTTVIRKGDPDNPKIKRRSNQIAFAPSGRPNVYRAVKAVDPASGEPYAWARIAGNTLTVYSMIIHDDGGYEIHQYDRTLTGTGMELEFSRLRDGERGLGVSARLIKEAE